MPRAVPAARLANETCAGLGAAVFALCVVLSGAGEAVAAESGAAPAKKEYTDAEFDADSTACRVEAQIKVLGPDGNGKREVTVAQAVERDGVYKVTRDLIAACMAKKGY